MIVFAKQIPKQLELGRPFIASKCWQLLIFVSDPKALRPFIAIHTHENHTTQKWKHTLSAKADY
jgi:hypothetical protein